jgi:hypothetical protein
MKFQFKQNGYDIELSYSDKGVFDFAINAKTGEALMTDFLSEGGIAKISEANSMLGGTMTVCDARYLRIVEPNVFVPFYLLVPNR